MPTFRAYLTGFIICLLLTLGAYFSVVSGYPKAFLIVTCLAIAQFAVQIIFFLHLGQGKDGRWNLISFALAFGGMFVVIFGSIWIMQNLNYRMTPEQMETHVIEDEGIQR